MTTLNFPSSPATGNVYSFGGKTWVYNGTAWDIQTSQLTTANVAEAVPNLYFTNTRAELALQPTIAELRAAITAPCANVIYVSKNGNDNNTGHTEGNALANIHVALARAVPWTTVFLKSGDYTLYNQPVTIGRRVGLVGDNLRTTTIRPEQPAVDMFYVNNGCYVTGITFRDHIAPSAVFSYNPDGSAGTIVTSPYIQNSSSITTTGTGMRVDGRYVSGLRSMVCDSYTQTNEGGIGIHMLNRGYTQLVSVFTICCHIAIKCETGGFCSITNSNASFGTYALYADGVSEPLYYGKLAADTTGQEFTFTNLTQRPNYGDSVLFAEYDQAKCVRDAGLIVDSLAFDLAYGGNSQSNFAGLQYWSQSESAIPNQSVETIAAINYAKSLAMNVVANIRVTSTFQASNVQQFAVSPALIADAASNIKIASEFDIITSIISNGTTGVTDLIVPNSYPANTNAFVNHASNLLYRNNAFISSEVVAYVNNTYPSFSYNANTCARDVRFILDTIRFDLLHGGNKQAVQAGTYYYNYNADVTQINDQVVQTGAAYNYIGEVITNVITKNKNAGYNQDKCERDTGLIVDSILMDLAYGSNSQSIFAGLQYWAQSESAIPNQSEETIAAITYARNVARTVATDTLVSNLQSNVAQVRGTAGGSESYGKITSEFDLIVDIITNGTVGVTDRIIPNSFPANTTIGINNGANLIYLNKSFIAAEVIAYVNQTYPGFFANANNFIDVANAETKCSRDVGYMIDSVRFDMMHDGNRQAIQAGTYYYNYNANVTQISDQIVKTGQAYDYIAAVAGNVVQNSLFTATFPTYQTDVTQNTTAYTAATVAEANIILNKVAIIKNIITNGPSVSPAKIPISYSAITNANLSNAAKILLLNKDFIKSQTIAFVNAVLFDPPYQTDVKQNTTAAPASTYATANLVLQNIRLITNVITQGPNVAAPKLPIGLTANTDPNVINATKLILANRDYIKAETIAFVNRSWSSISNGTGTYYTVKNATPLVGNTSTVTLLETVFTPILANTAVSFHQGSYISSSGHTFEYVGSGDTIATALPYLGGIPKQENEITELRGGKVFFTSTDQRGDFRIGTGLVINRVDGTITGRTFNKALFAVMTPYMLAIEG